MSALAAAVEAAVEATAREKAAWAAVDAALRAETDAAVRAEGHVAVAWTLQKDATVDVKIVAPYARSYGRVKADHVAEVVRSVVARNREWKALLDEASAADWRWRLYGGDVLLWRGEVQVRVATTSWSTAEARKALGLPPRI